MTKVLGKLAGSGGMVMALVAANVLFSGCGCLWTTNGEGTGPACVKGTSSVPFHVVMANEHGQLEGPAKLPPDEQPPSNYILDYHATVPDQEARSAELVARMASFQSPESVQREEKDCAIYPPAGNVRKVLIFIHGGLNEPVDTLKQARDLHDEILCAGYYPIFINWRSSLVSSYTDHLFAIRQGRYYPPKGKDILAGVVWSPGYIFSDVMRGIGRVFLSTGQLLMNDIDGGPACPGYWFCDSADPVEAAKKLRGKKFDHVSTIQNEDTSLPKSFAATFPWLLTLPLQLVTAPVLDTAGAGAWGAMLHRTTTLFHTDDELNMERILGGKQQKQGGVEVFLQTLKKQITKDKDEGTRTWQFVLVGHSMGTIIMNQIVRDYGEDFPISHIVYLAAACSIRDYQDTVWPYLQLQHFRNGRDPSHEKKPITQVHHLMLHPKAESQDTVPFIADYTPLQWYNLVVCQREVEG